MTSEKEENTPNMFHQCKNISQHKGLYQVILLNMYFFIPKLKAIENSATDIGKSKNKLKCNLCRGHR